MREGIFVMGWLPRVQIPFGVHGLRCRHPVAYITEDSDLDVVLFTLDIMLLVKDIFRDDQRVSATQTVDAEWDLDSCEPAHYEYALAQANAADLNPFCRQIRTANRDGDG